MYSNEVVQCVVRLKGSRLSCDWIESAVVLRNAMQDMQQLPTGKLWIKFGLVLSLASQANIISSSKNLKPAT